MIAAIALAVTVGLYAPQAQGRIQRLVAELGREREYSVRLAAYRELMRTKPAAALGPIAAAIASWGPNSQGLAISLIQQYPRARASAALGRLIESTSPFVRGASAAALWRLGQRDRLGPLVRALADPATPGATQRSLLGRCYGIKAPALLAAVRGLVVPDGDPASIDSALYFLLQAGDGATDDRARAIITATDAARRLRLYAAVYLAARGATGLGPTLAELWRSEASSFLRTQRYLTVAPALADDAVTAITAYVEATDSIADLRAAARILGRHGRGRSVAALRKLLAHADSSVVKAALEALAAHAGAVETKDLHRLLASTSDELALGAAKALRRRDDPSGLARVVEIARGRGPHRAGAVRLLGEFRMRAAVEPLLDALLDADARVRRNAMAGLTTVWRALLPYRTLDIAATGYQPSAGVAQRRTAVEKLRAWWRTKIAKTHR